MNPFELIRSCLSFKAANLYIDAMMLADVLLHLLPGAKTMTHLPDFYFYFTNKPCKIIEKYNLLNNSRTMTTKQYCHKMHIDILVGFYVF